MKLIAILLKIVGYTLLVFSLLSFGIDFIPVEWIGLGHGISSDEHIYYYKGVPTEGAHHGAYKLEFLGLGIGAIILARFITKKKDKSFV